MARNSEEDPEISEVSEAEIIHRVIQNIDDIDSQILASQYINAFKMIPGSFCILGKKLIFFNHYSDSFKSLGIFVASENSVEIDEIFIKSANKLLCDMMWYVNCILF